MKKNNFNNTDVGNSKRLVLYHGKNLRYCYSVGCWFVWNGQYWEKDDGGIIETLAKDTVKKIYEEAEQEDSDRRTDLIKHGKNSESRQKINNMIALAQSEDGIPVKHQELDGDHWKLNCQNGVIDLKTGELLSHNRDYLMTHMIPVDYDPNADCPNWKSFLNRIMQDENGLVREVMIPFLQQAIGYSLTGSIKEQVMFVLYGSGRNGKSTFINVIKDLLGDYAKQASPYVHVEAFAWWDS
jgi:putative DNA primase/helicase